MMILKAHGTSVDHDWLQVVLEATNTISQSKGWLFFYPSFFTGTFQGQLQREMFDSTDSTMTSTRGDTQNGNGSFRLVHPLLLISDPFLLKPFPGRNRSALHSVVTSIGCS